MNDHERLKQLNKAISEVAVAGESMHHRIIELVSIAEAEERRAAEANERLAACQRLYEEAKGPAQRTVALEVASRKLIEALDRLPVRMQDAAMVQTSHPPEIALYGTHDWATVVEAKFALKKAMKGAP